jgi:hypothetical protein
VNDGFRRPLPPFDETAIYQAGLQLPQVAPPWNRSPLAALLYRALSDPASADRSYHRMRWVTSALVLLAAWVCLRAAGGARLAWLPGIFLAFNLFAHLSAYTPQLAAMIPAAMAGYFLVRQRFAVAAATFILGALVRPEFLGAGAVLLGLGLAAGKLRGRGLLAPALALFLVFAAMRLWPDPGPGRLAEAFQQHYAWTQADLGWKGDNWTQYQAVMARDFPGAEPSLTAYYKANPAAVRAHIWHNVDILPRELRASASIKPLGWDQKHPNLVVCLSAWTLLLWFLGGRKRVDWNAMKAPVAKAVWLCVPVLGLLPSWLLIRPRPVYLIAALPLFYAALCLLADGMLKAGERA